MVIATFDDAFRLEPDAPPLLHSDRGFQYTSAQFRMCLNAHHMKQSMSRVAHCINNCPTEAFCGILKQEMYYGHRFTSREALVTVKTTYIDYNTNGRLLPKLGVMTPMAYHDHFRTAAQNTASR